MHASTPRVSRTQFIITARHFTSKFCSTYIGVDKSPYSTDLDRTSLLKMVMCSMGPSPDPKQYTDLCTYIDRESPIDKSSKVKVWLFAILHFVLLAKVTDIATTLHAQRLDHLDESEDNDTEVGNLINDNIYQKIY